MLTATFAAKKKVAGVGSGQAQSTSYIKYQMPWEPYGSRTSAKDACPHL
ncbi:MULTISPECIES: hypothetical protein [unclassified Lentimonas]